MLLNVATPLIHAPATRPEAVSTTGRVCVWIFIGRVLGCCCLVLPPGSRTLKNRALVFSYFALAAQALRRGDTSGERDTVDYAAQPAHRSSRGGDGLRGGM